MQVIAPKTHEALWYDAAAMLSRTVRFAASFLLAAVIWLIPSSAFAQELPKLNTASPAPGGYCAPWHRCVAYAALGVGGLSVIAFGLGYVVQQRGFHRLEHRQGNPEGVPVTKD
jgi:hypothetical protein